MSEEEQEESAAERVLRGMILFLQERGMYDEYLRWRQQARRRRVLRARQLENEDALQGMPNSDVSTDEESSETSASEAE